MKLLFFIVHPAGYHLIKNIVNRLKDDHDVYVLIVKKDVLEELVKAEGWKYKNIFPQGRRSKRLPILLSTVVNMFRTHFRLFKEVRSFKPDLCITDDGTLAHVCRPQRIPTYIFNEDDVTAVWEHHIVYPFANKVFAPNCCEVGRWSYKKVGYEGYHELAYLHPKYFTPKKDVLRQYGVDPDRRFFILRLAELRASHDIGRSGIDRSIAHRLVDTLKMCGDVYITSERELESEFEKYRLAVHPKDIHHFLNYADLYVGDSQTMTAECAVLGTPALRFNDFVGQLGYLEELEHKYKLTFGFRTSNVEGLYRKLDELLAMDDLRVQWYNRRERLLSEKEDVVDVFINEIGKLNESSSLRVGVSA